LFSEKAMNRALTITLALLLSTSCATSPLGRKQLMLMPDNELKRMGLQAFQQMKRKAPISRSPQINAYVRCVSDAIISVIGGQWEVIVFEDKTPNAFALPGGKIGVHTGLLKVAANQHQLATVIAHEVAHVLSRHSNERISQKLALEQGLNLGLAIAAPQTATGKSLLGLLGLGAQYGILLPYSRTHEREADLLGLDIMARAGFDPRESVALWLNMNRASNRGQPLEFLSTHPAHQTRIQDLKARLPQTMELRRRALANGKNPQCTTSEIGEQESENRGIRSDP
jgi:predicted Zn-dependent protease